MRYMTRDMGYIRTLSCHVMSSQQKSKKSKKGKMKNVYDTAVQV
jgi:hypothetical protein